LNHALGTNKNVGRRNKNHQTEEKEEKLPGKKCHNEEIQGENGPIGKKDRAVELNRTKEKEMTRINRYLRIDWRLTICVLTTLFAKVTRPRKEQKSEKAAQDTTSAPVSQQAASSEKRTIFVSSMAFEVNDNDLKELFGTVSSSFSNI